MIICHSVVQTRQYSWLYHLFAWSVPLCLSLAIYFHSSIDRSKEDPTIGVEKFGKIQIILSIALLVVCISINSISLLRIARRTHRLRHDSNVDRRSSSGSNEGRPLIDGEEEIEIPARAGLLASLFFFLHEWYNTSRDSTTGRRFTIASSWHLGHLLDDRCLCGTFPFLFSDSEWISSFFESIVSLCSAVVAVSTRSWRSLLRATISRYCPSARPSKMKDRVNFCSVVCSSVFSRVSSVSWSSLWMLIFSFQSVERKTKMMERRLLDDVLLGFWNCWDAAVALMHLALPLPLLGNLWETLNRRSLNVKFDPTLFDIRWTLKSKPLLSCYFSKSTAVSPNHSVLQEWSCTYFCARYCSDYSCCFLSKECSSEEQFVLIIVHDHSSSLWKRRNISPHETITVYRFFSVLVSLLERYLMDLSFVNGLCNMIMFLEKKWPEPTFRS